jgi:hypothetical protein
MNQRFLASFKALQNTWLIYITQNYSKVFFLLFFFKTLKTIAKIDGNLMLQMENNYIAAMNNIKFAK